MRAASAAIAASSNAFCSPVRGLDLLPSGSCATITDSDSAATQPALAVILSAVRIEDRPYPVPQQATVTSSSSRDSSLR